MLVVDAPDAALYRLLSHPPPLKPQFPKPSPDRGLWTATTALALMSADANLAASRIPRAPSDAEDDTGVEALLASPTGGAVVE